MLVPPFRQMETTSEALRLHCNFPTAYVQTKPWQSKLGPTKLQQTEPEVEVPVKTMYPLPHPLKKVAHVVAEGGRAKQVELPPLD